MPFDSALRGDVFQATFPDSLGGALNKLGIRPISPEFLEQHKAAEAAKHPANLWFRLRMAPALLSLVVGVTTSWTALHLLGAINKGPFLAIIGTMLAVLLGITLAMATIEIGMTWIRGMAIGPAFWSEYHSRYLGGDVPPELRALANRIRDLAPNVLFTVGELHNERVTFDPYLIVTDDESSAVLGIWDDNGIIARATTVQVAPAR